MNVFSLVYRSVRWLMYRLYRNINYLITIVKLNGNNITYGGNFRANGIPQLDIWKNAKVSIGENFSMNNGGIYNLIGRQQPCIFVVADRAKLEIGNNVGISSTAIVCHKHIKIGNNVKIGGNTVIYDTDFHSLNPNHWISSFLDKENTKVASVTIGSNVFIGAHTTILKGVTIGDNSIIGAGSVVTKSIPKHEIWAGNPAKLIRKNYEIL